MKRITRRQARAWLLPMRDCLRSIRTTGNADTIGGYAVVIDERDGTATRIDYCIAGFVGLIDRICPTINTAPLTAVMDTLADRQPITIDALDAALRTLSLVEDAMILLSVDEVQSARLTEEIQIELDSAADERQAA